VQGHLGGDLRQALHQKVGRREGDERTAEFVAEFVRRKVDVIVMGRGPAVRAARQATSVIPIESTSKPAA
jgi:hypothetical protein